MDIHVYYSMVTAIPKFTRTCTLLHGNSNTKVYSDMHMVTAIPKFTRTCTLLHGNSNTKVHSDMHITACTLLHGNGNTKVYSATQPEEREGRKN